MASSIVNDLMHMPGMHPQSPEWYSAQFIGCVFRGILDDAIAGCDVMQENITVRVNNLAAEGLRHRECPAIDGSTRRYVDRAVVTHRASHWRERAGTRPGYQRIRNKIGISGESWARRRPDSPLLTGVLKLGNFCQQWEFFSNFESIKY
jgi:hypothetical protein